MRREGSCRARGPRNIDSAGLTDNQTVEARATLAGFVQRRVRLSSGVGPSRPPARLTNFYSRMTIGTSADSVKEAGA